MAAGLITHGAYELVDKMERRICRTPGRIEPSWRQALSSGFRLAVFLDRELGVDRFDALGIARDLDRFV